jgi:predicted metal-dependent hydrolase
VTAPAPAGGAAIPVRRVRFHWPDDFEPVWTPKVPELAIAANAVSLQMPYLEPFVVATVRRALDELGPDAPVDDAFRERGRAYVAQEAQHHAQHRRFNDLLLARYPKLHRIERVLGWIFARLRNRSTRFGLAFSAGFETTAFVGARWVDDHLRLLRDADPTATTMFLWHMAEEVEHKEVAWDIYEASGGGRLRYAFATTLAGILLATFSLWATWSMLWSERRFLRPVAHARLVGWTLSFIFVALPIMVVSSLPGHHPRDLTDPTGFDHWLDHLDPETSTVPEWALP